MCTDIWSRKGEHTGCKESPRWASPPECNVSTQEPWLSLSCLSQWRYILIFSFHRLFCSSLCLSAWLMNMFYSLMSALIQRIFASTHSDLEGLVAKVSTQQTVQCASFIFPLVKYSKNSSLDNLRWFCFHFPETSKLPAFSPSPQVYQLSVSRLALSCKTEILPCVCWELGSTRAWWVKRLSRGIQHESSRWVRDIFIRSEFTALCPF